MELTDIGSNNSKEEEVHVNKTQNEEENIRDTKRCKILLGNTLQTTT